MIPPTHPAAVSASRSRYSARTDTSAVGVTRPPAAHVEPTLAPGRTPGSTDVDPGHGAVADLLVEATDQLWGERAHLRRPCRGLRPNHEDAVVEGVRDAVLGQLGAHDVDPSAHDTAHRCVGLPP